MDFEREHNSKAVFMICLVAFILFHICCRSVGEDVKTLAKTFLEMQIAPLHRGDSFKYLTLLFYPPSEETLIMKNSFLNCLWLPIEETIRIEETYGGFICWGTYLNQVG